MKRSCSASRTIKWPDRSCNNYASKLPLRTEVRPRVRTDGVALQGLTYPPPAAAGTSSATRYAGPPPRASHPLGTAKPLEPPPQRRCAADRSLTTRLLVLHGPLLDHLGTREPALYGHLTLAVLNARIAAQADALGVGVDCVHCPTEDALVAGIVAAPTHADALILNPGPLTHTSVAVRDAVALLLMPVIEVHLTNIAAREPFRHYSVVAPIVAGTIAGLGPAGYEAAVVAAVRLLAERAEGRT
ncbi:MAG: 3-dehydroquinate dehydratase [Deltaproteobacteria bacterium]|nr:3-dehydroquinate dehydratase [Deltaproteobacteria bacterium]